jgi:hypothetical protein
MRKYSIFRKTCLYIAISGLLFFPTRVYTVQPTKPSPDSFLAPELAIWLDSLRIHENCPTTGVIDSNALKSYGPYCFQLDTFDRYEAKYHISGPISDLPTQRRLVLLILHEPEGWRNWYTTVTRKIGLPPVDK